MRAIGRALGSSWDRGKTNRDTGRGQVQGAGVAVHGATSTGNSNPSQVCRATFIVRKVLLDVVVTGTVLDR